MTWTTVVLPLICLLGAAMPAAETVPLWPGPAPVSDGVVETPAQPPALIIQRPEHPDGRAVVICPGGGYGGKVRGPEGNGIAIWLGRHGITGCVLDYRLPAGRREVPLRDAQQAIRLLRGRADLALTHVGVMGFSAGGHLAGIAATHAPLALPDAPTCRPDFAILIYPVTTLRAGVTHEGTCGNLLGAGASAADREAWSPDALVGPGTPPVFLAHAVDDKLVPIEHSRLMYAALQRHGIASELLELPNGGHGLSGYKGPSWDAWQTASLAWLDRTIPAKR